MIRTESCTAEELATLRRGTPIPINTAAGLVEVDQVVDIVVQSLEEGPLQFYVLDETVDVVSEGLLVSEHGWTYHNSPETGPILSKPGRRRIKCHKESNVPLICANLPASSSNELPAPPAPLKMKSLIMKIFRSKPLTMKVNRMQRLSNFLMKISRNPMYRSTYFLR